MGSTRRDKLEAWLHSVFVIPADRDVTRIWGAIAARADERGRPRPAKDSWNRRVASPRGFRWSRSTSRTSRTLRRTTPSNFSGASERRRLPRAHTKRRHESADPRIDLVIRLVIHWPIFFVTGRYRTDRSPDLTCSDRTARYSQDRPRRTRLVVAATATRSRRSDGDGDGEASTRRRRLTPPTKIARRAHGGHHRRRAPRRGRATPRTGTRAPRRPSRATSAGAFRPCRPTRRVPEPPDPRTRRVHNDTTGHPRPDGSPAPPAA